MGSAMLAGWQKDARLSAEFHVIEPYLSAPELGRKIAIFMPIWLPCHLVIARIW